MNLFGCQQTKLYMTTTLSLRRVCRRKWYYLMNLCGWDICGKWICSPLEVSHHRVFGMINSIGLSHGSWINGWWHEPGCRCTASNPWGRGYSILRHVHCRSLKQVALVPRWLAKNSGWIYIYICISVSEDSRPSKLFLASQELKQRGREARGPGLFCELDQQLGV